MPSCFRNPLHVHVGRELGLRRAEPAERAVGRRVGHHGPAANTDVVAAVGAGRVNDAAREHDRAQRRVGPAVEQHVDIDGRQPAVARHAGSMADDRRVALGRRQHVLDAVVNQLHRAPRFQGEKRRVPGNHRRVLLLAAETAAGLGLHDADLIARQAQQHHQRAMHIVRTLQRAVHRHPASVIVGHRDHAVRLDVQLFLMTEAILPLDHQIGRRQSGIDVALVDADRLEDGRGGLRIEIRRGRAVVDLDVGRQETLAILVREQQDGLGDMPDRAARRDTADRLQSARRRFCRGCRDDRRW